MAPIKKRLVKYQTSLVAYTDILGFGELVTTSGAGKISRILRVFKEQHDYTAIPVTDPPKRHFTNFSDLCLVSTEIADPKQLDLTLFFELYRLAVAQLVLIRDHGIVIRGGVALGDAVRSRKLLFGPAIIEAYKLESEKAHNPRIVVSSGIISSITRMKEARVKSMIRELLRQDSDGETFVDYLALASRVPQYESFLSVHGVFVANGLQRANDRIRPKYEWLAQYQALSEPLKLGKWDKS
jgi:hypothetical protein